MGRTFQHPAKVRQRGAPGRIVQAPAQRSGGLHTLPAKTTRRGAIHELVGVAGPLPARSPLPPRQLPKRKAVLRGPRTPPRIPLRPGGRVVARNPSSHTQESRSPTVALGQRSPNLGGAGTMAEVA